MPALPAPTTTTSNSPEIISFPPLSLAADGVPRPAGRGKPRLPKASHPYPTTAREEPHDGAVDPEFPVKPGISSDLAWQLSESAKIAKPAQWLTKKLPSPR